jgi:hypothetical protein
MQRASAYAVLVGKHGRLVHRRWILREPVSDVPILNAPEMGSVADAVSMYQAVERMRRVPIGRGSFAGILIPLGLPMVGVVAMAVPIESLPMKFVKSVL